MEPVIAIANTGSGLFRRYMKSKYEQSLRRAGARTRWIDLEDVDEAIRQMMECDGMIMPGGADVDPKYYGQEVTDRCGKIDHVRDNAEFKMLEAFLPTKKPILCICRGEQLLNVFFGGTLYQDIKLTQLCKHTCWRAKNHGSHQVKIYPHTKLGRILGTQSERVNSLHHQAVELPGEGLRINAVSEDGFIEGLEAVLHPFCVGVQWHPEHMSKYSAQQRKIISAFVEACKTNT